MTDSKLRKALLTKLGITKQALSLRVQKQKKSLLVTTEDATYIIAHQSGIILDKYLSKETVNHVRGILSASAASKPGESPSNSKHSRTKQSLITKQVNINFPDFKKFSTTILDRQYLEEARLMAGVFPLLYVLENSMRRFIIFFYTKRHGKDWWDQAPKALRETVAKRQNEEDTKRWHQKRGAHPIHYTDLKEDSVLSTVSDGITPL